MKTSASDGRHPIESIATDFAESIRSGQHESIDPVVSENPELEPELRELLPLIKRLERARQSQQERPGGLASLGSGKPDRLGDFELVRQIGRGGMGVVFEALQSSLGRKVAVKVLPKSLLTDERQLQRFEQEARMAGSLHHTNIVPVFGVGEDQGFHYFVMQRIYGHGLDRVLSDQSQLRPRDVASLGRQAASALAYAHGQNVMHRDIKPANLIVDDQLQLWVTDFGVAKAIESEAVTRTGDIVGTLRYMAPEQIVGDADFRSDVYSLGVTLYELLAGRPAMDDASIRQALVSRRPAPKPPPLRQLNPEVPRDLATIIATAMSVDPDLRYQTAEALADDLRRFLRGEPISVRPLTALQRGVRWARRNPALAALTMLLLCSLMAIAIVSSVGFVRVQQSLDRELVARANAEAYAELASGALNQIFERFSSGGGARTEFANSFSSTPALSDEAAELLEDLLKYYDGIASRNRFGPQLHQSTADARYTIGDIHFRLGNYDRAIDAFQLALQETPIDPAGTAQLRRARIHNRIGLAFRYNGNRDQANTEHRMALQILSSPDLQPEVQTREQRFELARTHYLLTMRLLPGMGPTEMPPLRAVNMYRRPARHQSAATRGDQLPRLQPDEAVHLQAAIEILKSLHDQQPEHGGIMIALAIAIHRSEVDADANAAVISDDRQSIRILRDLFRSQPDNDEVRFELSEMLADANVFGNGWDQQELELTIARLQEAITHLEALSNANPNVPKYTNSVAHAHFKLGILLERQGRFSNQGEQRELEQRAGLSFREAARRYTALLKRHQDAPGYRAWHAVFLQHQAEMAVRMGLWEQAETVLQRSIKCWTRLTESHPEEEISWHALPEVYELLARAQERLGEYQKAQASMLEADLSRLYREAGQQ